MESKQLNKRKSEILDQQELMLKKSQESKVALTETENAQFDNLTKEYHDVQRDINRYEAINKGRSEVSTPANTPVISDSSTNSKFYALGSGARPGAKPVAMPNIDADYMKNFWASCVNKTSFDKFLIQNAALGEGGTTAAGGALVPIETDPQIPAMKLPECAARGLSTVIETEMNINLPYQASRTAAALKPESNSTGTNNFSETDPTFGTTLLSAYTVGGKVQVSWELLRDSKAANQFIPADLQRAIRIQEESLFISGTGSSQPQGYLGNATTATGASITAGAATLGINPILDTMASLNKAYYIDAKWLVNRAEAVRLLKAQLAANQYQTYFQFEDSGDWRLLGFPMAFSNAMPTYVASPATNGAWLFGDFKTFAVIGDRGGSNIYVKVLDQIQAVAGQTVVLGYRFTDQRVRLQEACVELLTNG